MKTKRTWIGDAIVAFICLNIFVRGLYTISSASGVTMSKALKSIKTEEASLEEISAAMINLAQSKVALGGVLTFVGGIGLIVCMHWLFICLKDTDFTYSKNK